LDTVKIAAIVKILLEELGEDSTREGLRDTPERVARFYQEFLGYLPENSDTTFEAVRADQLVVVKDIPIFSLCEHHLLPFWCDVAIGYLTHEKVLGLSKFARIAQNYAHQLQLQERLTQQIAETVEKAVQSPDVAVVVSGQHLCMMMRGIKTPAVMVTSVMLGQFRDNHELRSEFLTIVGQKGLGCGR
jgi:GTP cyclohydrolase I